MTLEEKKIYSQIHPVKLLTDVVTGFGAVYLLWYHDLIAAVCLAFIPSTVVSLILIAKTDLEKYKRVCLRNVPQKAHGIEILRLDPVRGICRHAYRGLDQHAVAGCCGVSRHSFCLDEGIDLRKARHPKNASMNRKIKSLFCSAGQAFFPL